MSDNYGDRYPGAGGARKLRGSNGPDWHPMPDGICEVVPMIERHVERHEPGFLGRLIGREPTEHVVETVVGKTVRKHYR